jgi:hypothetical protein
MSFEHHKPAQMNIFSERNANVEQPQPTPVVAAQIGSKVVQGVIPIDIDTGVHQDILEGQTRFAEFFDRHSMGKNTYDAFTIIGLDKAANLAQNGSSGHRLMLNNQGRTAEDIRRASDRYNSSNAQLDRRIRDLAAMTTVEAGLRAEYPNASPKNVEAYANEKIARPIVENMRYKYIDSKDAAKNRRKTASNLKKSIKVQEKTRAEIKAERIGVQYPQRLGNNDYRHN